MTSVKELGKKLDDMGWVLVNMVDPVDGSKAAALDWQQVAGLVADYDEAVQQHKVDIERIEERLTETRAQNLAIGAALTRVWEVVGKSPVIGFGTDPSEVPEAVADALQRARAEAPKIEITDTAVNDMALWFWGPSARYDREALRTALANALQTR